MTRTSHYRAHLDGIRTLAVYLVVLFHAGVARFSGGFIGVDVFFVLSGYLVTQTLLRDLDATGSIRFSRFYARRFRRLLPASAVALLVTAVVYRFVADPGQAQDATRSFQASFLYVANWHFIHEAAGYFGAAVVDNPLLHFWSLAVEEQFYAVWPLVLAGLFALFGRRRSERGVRGVQVAVLVGAVASFAWAMSLQGSRPNRAYYGTDTRAYQLLGGALLALAPGAIAWLARRGPRVRWLGLAAVVGLLGLSLSTVSAATLGPVPRGAITTVLTVALIASLEAAPTGALVGVLSTQPFVYLGRISYGTYLWHWPVIVAVVAVADPEPLPLAFITVLLASGLASLSSELMERRVVLSTALDAHRYAVIGVGLMISLVGGLVVVPALLDRAPPQTTRSVASGSRSGFTPVPKDLPLDAVAEARFGETVSCVDQAASECTVVTGTGEHVLLMGDSNAQMLIPAFTAMAKANDLTLSLSVIGGCPWERGMYAVSPEVKARCKEHKEDAYDRVIPRLKPDIVVLVDVARSVEKDPITTIRALTVEALAELEAPGRTLVLVEPIIDGPLRPQPLPCLKDATYLEDCRYVAETEPSPTDRVYRSLAKARNDTKVLNLDRLVCPYLPICDPVVDGRIVRWDYQHIATAYSASLGPEMADAFETAGLLP